MINSHSIELSTYELVSCLALCGYESMASQVLNSIQKGDHSEEENFRFLHYSEQSLRLKGYWDENRSSMLVSGLENLLHLLVQSKKKVRCINEDRVLFIHLINGRNILIQDIRNQVHSFTIKNLVEKEVMSILAKHFRLRENKDSKIEFHALNLTEEIFNKLHMISSSYLNNLLKDRNLDATFKAFLTDFKKNNQEFDNISLMEMDYVKDYMEARDIIFMLPNEEYIWHLNYEKIEDKEVYIIPMEISPYLRKINDIIFTFFI